MKSSQLDYKRLRKIFLRVQIIITVFVFVIEIVDNLMLYLTRSQGYGPDTIAEKLFRYLLVTSLVNLLFLFLPIIVGKIRHYDDEKQCNATVIGISLLCFNIIYSHYQFLIVFALAVLPVMVSVMLEKKNVLKITILLNLVSMIVGGVFRGLVSEYNQDIIAEMVITVAIFVAFSIFGIMIVNTINKNRKELEDALVLAEQAKLIDQIELTKKELEAERDKLRTISEETFTALSNAVAFNDHYTNGHSRRVAMYSSEIAKQLNFSPERQREVYYAGLLHDVGKVGISNDIINKNGRLTDEEFEQIKMHPAMGYQILRSISSQGEFAAGARWHHERYDGKGYPDGLKGEEIPEISRIIAVADSYDAMTSKRSYRNTMSQEKVREQIEQGKGSQFDPHFADIMLQMIDEDTDYTLRQDTDRKYNIIVIDDDVTSIDQIRGILKNDRYNVIGATSFETGFNIINTIIPDFVLMDIMMPGTDGFAALRKIRAEGKAVPVCFMSGSSDVETINKAKKMGALDFFVKPVVASELKEVLHATFLDV